MNGSAERPGGNHLSPGGVIPSMNASLPVLLLSGAGIVIAVLGLFAAGDIAIVAVGLGSIFAAGVLHVAELAVRSRRHDSSPARPEDDHLI